MTTLGIDYYKFRGKSVSGARLQKSEEIFLGEVCVLVLSFF